MKTLQPRYLPVLGVLLLIPWFAQQWLAKGLPMYATDDAYIHLSIAKHVVRDHVWGVTPFEYAPASSSLLWTGLLVALGSLIGISPWMPFAINAVVLLGMLVWACRQEDLPKWAPWAIAFSVPSAYFVITGMECVLQSAISLALVVLASRWIRGGSSATALILVALLAGAVRYEGVLLVFALATGMGFYSRTWKVPAHCALAAIVVPIGFAVFSLANGGSWLPYSVLVKASGEAGLVGRVWQALHAIYEVGIAPWIALAVFIGAGSLTGSRVNRAIALPVCLVFVLQVVSGACSWRYCAWFMPVAVILLGHMQLEWHEKVAPEAIRAGVIAWATLMVLPALFMVRTAMQAALNYRTFHLPIAEYVALSPEDSVIGLYDIGLTTFVADRHIVDFAGLASREVARARMGKSFTTATMETISSRANLTEAIIFPNQFEGSIVPPKHWIKVARWSISANAIALDDRMDFYATTPKGADQLRERLLQRASRLPTGLKQELEPH